MSKVRIDDLKGVQQLTEEDLRKVTGGAVLADQSLGYLSFKSVEHTKLVNVPPWQEFSSTTLLR